MATKYERAANSAFTYLQQAVAVADTTIKVHDIRRFITNSVFRIRVGKEIMLVTNVDSDKTLTVTRGAENTLVRAHNINDLVISVFTQGSLDQILTDRVLYAKTRPQVGKLTDSSGIVMKVADMTWNNQGSATAIDVNGTIWMNGLRAASNDGHGLLTSAPGTPWTFTFGFRQFIANSSSALDGFSQSGILLKNSGNPRVILYGVFSRQGTPTGAGGGNLKTSVENMNSATSFNSTAVAATGILHRYDDITWHRVTDNGTNLLFDVSRDGVNWTQLASLGRTAWLTSGPNQVGFYIDPSGTESAGGTNMDNYCAACHMSFS